jgi:tetratricopeptide (TPR) repeat protein
MAEPGEIERALQRDPDDAELRLVFADSLIARGDPWGELIVLASKPATTAQRRRERELRLGIERQLAEITTVVGKRCARLVWNRGTIEHVDFDLLTGSRPVLAELLARPELAFLRELELRLAWPTELPAAEATLVELPAMIGALPLRFLGVGSGHTTMPPDLIEAIWAAVPRLSGLGVFSERFDDALAAVRNHRPSIVDLGAPDFDAARLRRFLGELWPGIVSLVVYVGRLERADLEPLVEPGAFPGLQRLGVMCGSDTQNDTFVDVLAERGALERLAAIGMTVFRADASNQRLLHHKRAAREVELFTAPISALRQRYGWIETWHDLGHLFDELGRHDRALAEFEALVTLVPGDARFLQDIGEQLAHLGRHDEALVALDAALVIDPDHERALHSRALSLAELERLDDALAAWDRVQEGERETEAYLWDGRADTLARLGKIDEAIAACDRSLELVRGDLDTVAMRARLLAHAERFEAAIDAFTKLARRKAASDADKARAHTRLAQIHAQLGKPALARKQLARAAAAMLDEADRIAVAKSHAAFLLEHGDPAADVAWQGVTGGDEPCGYTFLELGRPAEALAAFERAGARHGKALALHALGRDDEANAILERAWTEETCPYAFAVTALAGAAVATARGRAEGRERWLRAIRSDETGCRASHELLFRGAAAIRTTPDDDHGCALAACRARTTVALIAAALADGAVVEATQRTQALAAALEQWNSTSPRLHEVRIPARELCDDQAHATLTVAVRLAEGQVPRRQFSRPAAARSRPARPKRPV